MTAQSQSKVPDERIAAALIVLAEQATEFGIILHDAAGNVTWWSPGAERIFGKSSAEAAGRHTSMIFTPEDLARGIAELEMTMASSNATAEDDRWHVRADGTRFWSSGAMVALRSETGELVGFGKILRDRTKHKEQLERMRSELEAAHELASTHQVGIATLSHELRNVVAGLTHGLKMLRGQGSAAQRRDELLRMMEEQVSLVHRLTEDLLDISRLSRGKLQLKRVPLVLQQVLRQTIVGSIERANKKGVQVEELVPPAPVRIIADKERLLQVFNNLLDNAIKYTPKGGRVWVKLTVEDPEAVVHIEDTGIGIPGSMLLEIFDLFTQVETEATSQGLGIGLTLVKNLVALHGGTVQARSDGDGKGSEFTVRLPLEGSP